MATLSVSIVANVRGVDIPWEDLSPDLKREISTKLHNDAMSVAGYEKAPKKRQLHREQTNKHNTIV